jgi:hypothetical protein
MTDTKTTTHRLKIGSWACREYGPLEGRIDRGRGFLIFHTTDGHSFDVYPEEIEELE